MPEESNLALVGIDACACGDGGCHSEFVADETFILAFTASVSLQDMRATVSDVSGWLDASVRHVLGPQWQRSCRVLRSSRVETASAVTTKSFSLSRTNRK